MLKFRRIVFLSIAVSALLSLCMVTANAQRYDNPSQQQTDHARSTGPCQDPWVTIAFSVMYMGTYYTPNNPDYIRGSGNSGDCATSQYNRGSWNNFNELYLGVYERKMSQRGVYYVGAFKGNDGNQYLVFKNQDGALVGLNVGSVVGTGSSSVLTNNGGTLVNTNGSNVVAAGGGNWVSPAAVIAAGGGNVIASGGGNVVAAGGGNVVASGAGNMRRLSAVGETGFQLPNRWVVVKR